MSARIKLLTSAAASSSTLASSLSGTVTRHRYDLFVADGQGGSPASHHEHRLSRGQRHGDLRIRNASSTGAVAFARTSSSSASLRSRSGAHLLTSAAGVRSSRRDRRWSCSLGRLGSRSCRRRRCQRHPSTPPSPSCRWPRCSRDHLGSRSCRRHRCQRRPSTAPVEPTKPTAGKGASLLPARVMVPQAAEWRCASVRLRAGVRSSDADDDVDRRAPEPPEAAAEGGAAIWPSRVADRGPAA